MARYDYICPACNHIFEVEHPMDAHPDVACPRCGSYAQRHFGTSAVVFKGSGFYNTDQRGKDGQNGAGKAGAPHSCADCPHRDA